MPLSPLPVAATRKNTLEGLAGDYADVTLFAQLRTADTHRRAGGVFNGSSLDPNYAVTVAANGTATVLNGTLIRVFMSS